MMSKEKCYVCKGKAENGPQDCHDRHLLFYECESCGNYVVVVDDYYDEGISKDGSLAQAKAGYALYHGKLRYVDADEKNLRSDLRGKKWREISEESLDEIFSNEFELPDPLTQDKNLLHYIGEKSQSSGCSVNLGDADSASSADNEILKRQIQFKMGSPNSGAISNAAERLVAEKLLLGEKSKGYSLTTQGWKRCQSN